MLLKKILDLLEKDKDSLLDILRQLHSLAQVQKEIVEKGGAEEIEKYSRQKEEQINALNDFVSEIQKKIKQIQTKGDSSDKESADRFIFDLKKEYQSIVQDIIDIESKDKELITKMRDAIGIEIKEIERVKGKLKGLKASYASNGESLLFDKEA